MTAAALVVMPVLAVAKRRTGQALGNRTLVADSAETAFCAFTSAAALLGIGLNAWLGWWWADPAAALIIAALAVREGIESWETDDEASRCGRSPVSSRLPAGRPDPCDGLPGPVLYYHRRTSSPRITSASHMSGQVRVRASGRGLARAWTRDPHGRDRATPDENEP